MTSTRAHAMPSLTISVQDGTNVVLGWPSIPGTTYLIQYASTLSTNTAWEDLTNFYPASVDSNWTSFLVTNAIIPACGGDTNELGTNGPPGPDNEISGGRAVLISSDASGTNEIQLPPSPWDYFPQTGQSQTITRSGYISANDGFESDTSTNADGCEASGPGFFRVVANGVTCVGITNNVVLSDMVTIPLEIAVANGDPISGATLQVDGNPVAGGSAIQGTNNLWTFTLDTTTIPNGVHQLTASVIFGEDALDVEMTNAYTVAVSNVLWFPNYFNQIYGIGEGMWVNAQAMQSNIDWEIDLYDSQTNYLGYFADYSADGSINFVWGLQTNMDSPPLTDPGFLLEYYLWDADTGEPLSLSPAGSIRPDASAPAASKWRVGEALWNVNAMAVACGPVDGNVNHLYNIQDMMRDGVLTACEGHFPGGLQPQPNDPHGQPWTWGANGDKYTLMQVLPGCQYFYYFGHGSPTSFGPTANTDIKNYDLMTNLGNFPGFPYPAATNRHPYKLVFIDGCMTAGGNLPDCFGIPSGQYDTNFFNDMGARSRAYIGYSKKISFSPDQWATRSTMLKHFYENWFGNRSIYYCVTNAENDPDYPMDSSVVIYGATNMNIRTY